MLNNPQDKLKQQLQSSNSQTQQGTNQTIPDANSQLKPQPLPSPANPDTTLPQTELKGVEGDSTEKTPGDTGFATKLKERLREKAINYAINKFTRPDNPEQKNPELNSPTQKTPAQAPNPNTPSVSLPKANPPKPALPKINIPKLPR